VQQAEKNPAEQASRPLHGFLGIPRIFGVFVTTVVRVLR
jgi:hypothetical protein